MAPQIACFGELLLRLAAPGCERLLQTPALQVFVGGAEANVAATLAAFGHRTAMISAVPGNSLGMATLAHLRAHDIDATHVPIASGRMGLYFHTRGAMQRPPEVLYDREHSSFALADPGIFDWTAVLNGKKWLHISGITAAVSDRAAQSALNAIKTARTLQVSVSFDCNYRARVWGARSAQAPRILHELCSAADLLIADDRDLGFITNNSVSGAAAFNHFPHLQWLARTQRDVASAEQHGYSGEILTRKERAQSSSCDLTGIVERIGAGDAFAAGILHGLISNSSLQRTVDFATAAACFKHSLPGDACIASVAEIDAWLNGAGANIKR
jgi:2-dehydro-3-deoxygluconokinase